MKECTFVYPHVDHSPAGYVVTKGLSGMTIEECVSLAAELLKDIAWLEGQIEKANRALEDWEERRREYGESIASSRAQYRGLLEKVNRMDGEEAKS